MSNSGKTKCRKCHEYKWQNSYILDGRVCRTCYKKINWDNWEGFKTIRRSCLKCERIFEAKKNQWICYECKNSDTYKEAAKYAQYFGCTI